VIRTECISYLHALAKHGKQNDTPPMQTYTTTRRAVQELNTPTTAPESPESLDEIIQKILCQLDTINAQIDAINSQLKTIQ